MLDCLSRGDKVVVWKLDRLGRTTRHMLELLDDFKARGIKFPSPCDGMAIAASHGRKAGRREVTPDDTNVQQAHVLKKTGPKPADIAKIIEARPVTVYRYLSMNTG